MKLGTPYELRIMPVNGKKQFRFLLRFHGRTQPVEFETSADAAMAMLKALQRIQELHKLPIPQGPLRKGKPRLVIVNGSEQNGDADPPKNSLTRLPSNSVHLSINVFNHPLYRPLLRSLKAKKVAGIDIISSRDHCGGYLYLFSGCASLDSVEARRMYQGHLINSSA